MTKFEEKLAKFIKVTTVSKQLALELSIMALEHFKEHGQVAQLQQFHDAMPENFHRRAALLLWLRDHSPITMEGGKFFKDKTEDAIAFNLEGALAKPFWDYAPPKEQVQFGKDDVIVQLKRVVSRFKSKRYDANDEDALAMVDKAEEAIRGLTDAKPKPGDATETETDDVTETLSDEAKDAVQAA